MRGLIIQTLEFGVGLLFVLYRNRCRNRNRLFLNECFFPYGFVKSRHPGPDPGSRLLQLPGKRGFPDTIICREMMATERFPVS
jgi:hypothetical protein